jgi:hypothetical protein
MSDTNKRPRPSGEWLRNRANTCKGVGLFSIANTLDEAADALDRQGAEIDRLRARYVPCAVCQRPVDTWEEWEGGNAYGCQFSRGRWACSIQCWHRFVVRSEAVEQTGGGDEPIA